MIKIIAGFILIIIISGANAQPLVIRPRKESTVLSNREKIQTIKEFGQMAMDARKAVLAELKALRGKSA